MLQVPPIVGGRSLGCLLVKVLLVQFGRFVVLLSGKVEVVGVLFIAEELMRWLLLVVYILLLLLGLLAVGSLLRVFVPLLPAGFAASSGKEWLLGGSHTLAFFESW